MVNSLKLAALLIAEFEGFEHEAYWDKTGEVWTIGYGSTFNPLTKRPVKQGDVIDRPTALLWLETFIENTYVGMKVLLPILNTNQEAAVLTLAYNTGLPALRNSTTFSLLKAGRLVEAAGRFRFWNRSGGVPIRGLKIRRAVEAELFKHPKELTLEEAPALFKRWRDFYIDRIK
jgi:lysozyme